MKTNFYSLNLEKQERIINAALKEFVKNGFEKTSTNEIVKAAEISKGSLFNYFNNKHDLYVYLIDHAIETIGQIYQEIDLSETDIFNRLGQIGLIKVAIFKKHPDVFNFLKAITLEESFEVKEEISRKIEHTFKEGLDNIYQNIDYAKFKDDIDIEKAIEIINWTMIGFGEKAKAKLNSYQNINTEILEEWACYSEILKQSFYN